MIDIVFEFASIILLMIAQYLIKECNTEQRSFSNEIIEAFKAINEVSSMLNTMPIFRF